MQRYLLVAFAALVAACGSSTQEPEVVDNLAFQTADGEVVTLEDIRAEGDVRVMLISSMAGWCQPCIQEQDEFKRLHGKYSDRGLVILAAMFQDGEHQTPSEDYMRRWVDRYELPYLLLRDADYVLRKYYEGSPPMNMVVDADDMTILYLGAGYTADIERVIETNLK